jgi:UDP-N-acetylmuramoyl-tripeptide--D-alanyl-D-alanine ligase
MMDLRQAAQWLPASTLVGAPATRVTRVHSDTRSLRSGDLFVAIRGDHHDGNLFLAQSFPAS